MSAVLICYNIKSLTFHGYDIIIAWQNLGTVNT